MKTEWIDGRLTETRRIPCRTRGCAQVFEVDYLLGGPSSHDVLDMEPGVGVRYGDSEGGGWFVVMFSCPQCHDSWEMHPVSELAIAARPLTDARPRRHFDLAQIDRLARIVRHVGDLLDWVWGRVVVQACAATRRIRERMVA